MALSLYQLKVNTTDPTAGQSIAAYLVDAANNLLTSTVVAGVRRLNTNTASEFAEDSAHSSGDVGSFALAVRHDANTSLVSTDGDYAPLQVDAAGALKISGSITATSVFTAEHDEDSAAASGDSGVFTLLVRQDTLASSTSADGDYGAFKSNNKGELYAKDTDTLAELVLVKSDTASIVTNTSSTASSLVTLSKAEDAAASSGDQGLQALLVRQDTLASSTSADGDYGSFKSNAKGELYTKDTDTLAELVLVKSDTGSTAATLTALSKSEDAAHVSGDQGLQVLVVRHDANTSLVSADGDYSPLQVDSVGALKVSGTLTATFTAEHAEDDAAVSGDSGVAVLTVRQDALATDTSASGDYGFLKTTSLGEVWVREPTLHTDLVGTNLRLDLIEADTLNISTHTASADSTLTALNKIEDAPASSGDHGVQALLVRQDTLASSTSADGDYGSFKSNIKGELYVKDADTLAQTTSTATNTSTTAAALTALSKSEDAPASSGDQGLQVLAVRNDAGGNLTSTDGDYAALQLTATGRLRVSADSVTLSTQYAEDAGAASGDVGSFSLLVRQDTLASSTSADGDYGAFKSTAKGELYVKDTDTLAQVVLVKADTASTAASTATLATATHTEDAAAANADVGVLALAVRRDTTATQVSASGDYSEIQTWSNGELKVANIVNLTVLQQQVSVTNTAALIPTTSLANRKRVVFQNAGASAVWLGSSTVTTSGATTGIVLGVDASVTIEAGPAVALYAISNLAGGVAVNVLELS